MFSVSSIPGNGAWAFDLVCNARPGQNAAASLNDGDILRIDMLWIG
jgi:hypothetical protein